MSDNLEVAKECGIRVFNRGGYLECTGDAFEAYTSRILALQQAAHDAEIAKLKEEVAELTKQVSCDHDWKFQDDSFDHEFGTEQVHYFLCEKCGATRPTEPGDYATATPGEAGETAPDRAAPAEPIEEGPDVRPMEGEGTAGADIPGGAFTGEGGPLADIHFEYDSAALTDEARGVLEKHALWLQGQRDARVTIEGHCAERGTVEYNLALGEQRARATREYLVSLGVGASRLRVVSYGKERPLDPGGDEAAHARNRRAKIFAVSMSTAPALPSARVLWALFAAFALLWFANLDSRRLVHPEEGRYPEIAREMAVSDVNRILEIEETTKHDVVAILTNVAEYVGSASRHIHYGMTSSDILDTTLSYQMKAAGEILMKQMLQLKESLKIRAIEHKNTLCIGRSHGIHAEPTTMGLKFALWYEETKRNIKRLQSAIDTISVGQISGAVGTFEHLSPKVEEYVC